MEERRSAVRWNVVLPVRYVEPLTHREGSCMTQDVSTKGARLAVSRKYNPGDGIDMMLELPGSKDSPVRVEAGVVWQQESSKLQEECNYMTGVEFIRIRDHYKQILFDYVSANYPHQIRNHWWDGV